MTGNIPPCQCNNVDFGTFENSVAVPCPHHMENYRAARNAAGLQGDWIIIDKCILAEMLFLWQQEIHTRGCCCGHGKIQSIINVRDEDIPRMLSLGYRQNHIDPARKDTFELNVTALNKEQKQ